MLITVANILMTIALSMDVEVNSDWFPDDGPSCVDQLSGKSSDKPSEPCSRTKKLENTYTNEPPKIYNGF